jgi:hypothetical protein
MRFWPRHFVAAFALSLLSACKEGEPPLTEPTPLTYTFSLGSTFQTAQPWTFWLEDAREEVANQIAVAVVGDFQDTCRVHKIRASFTYDSTVLQVVNHTEGPFMQQGDTVPDTTLTHGVGRVTFRIDRPDSVGGVSGRDHVIIIRFRPVNNVARGSVSPLKWTEAHAYTANFIDCLHAARDAEISVR